MNLKKQIALNRDLPEDWCLRKFNKLPSLCFAGAGNASRVLLHHIKQAQGVAKQKFQIVVDSDLDGMCSAAIMYIFLNKYFPEVETVYSLHTGKQHGLSKDIKIKDDVTLVICPDSGSNDIEQCKALCERGIDVICLDHHIIEKPNQYASIVNCMDGVYPNTNLCGAAVTWLFLYGFCEDNSPLLYMKALNYLCQMLDLVAVATISDIMQVTNNDNMYFLQNGLANINSQVLKTFLVENEIPLNNVTIEHIKYKVSPLISAMIRMGSMDEKDLLFRAFIDDYEEFDYTKRGSFEIEVEDIYKRVFRLCKNAKSRQDRAKKKLLEECKVYEYPSILLVEYYAENTSTLTGLVANELAKEYCKPCIVYRADNSKTEDPDGHVKYSGSIRNYDGSPIYSFKDVLEFAFEDKCNVSGHDNAAGIIFKDMSPDEFAQKFDSALFSSGWEAENDLPDVAIGEKLFEVDFAVDADLVDVGLIKTISEFDHYTGYGFFPVTVLINGIKVSQENFKTMGKNTLNWKITDEDTGVAYVKFKIDRSSDELIQKFDDIDFGFTSYSDTYYVVNAICTFGLNVYNGEVYAQAIIKDYEIVSEQKKEIDFQDNDDFDFEL